MLSLACATPKSYVILSPETPLRPVFVVVPFNKYSSQIEFANDVEEAIINAGIRAIRYSQAKKEVTTEEAVGKAQASGETKKSKEKAEGQLQAETVGAKRTIKTIEYEGLDAEYSVETNKIYNRIRIIKLDTQEVLVSANVSVTRKVLYDQIYDFLLSIGTPVKKDYEYNYPESAKRRGLNPALQK